MPPKKQPQPPTPWEVAKPILMKYYMDGDVTDGMKPSEVWLIRPEFMKVNYENFRNNFAAMKRTIRKHRNRAEIDEAGFLHDVAIYGLAEDTPGCWDGSKAQKLLRRDIEKERHTKMKPELLWLSRSEYQEFDLNKFRGHIHQETRAERETNHWIVKKKKKQQQKDAKLKGIKFNEEDVDFLYDPFLEVQSA